MSIRELLHRSQTRIDLLFTMSDIPHTRVSDDTRRRSDVFADDVLWTRWFGTGPASLFELRRGSLRHDPARRAVAGAATQEPKGEACPA